MSMARNTHVTRILLTIPPKLFPFLVKVCAVIVVGFVSVIGLLVLCLTIRYSDGALYSEGKECIVDSVGVDRINDEVQEVFAESDWEWELEPKEKSCLGKVSRELSNSSYFWERTYFGKSKALVLRFGCHYNYAWLVIVDPADRVFDKDNKIRRIADNIGVCFDKGKIGH